MVDEGSKSAGSGAEDDVEVKDERDVGVMARQTVLERLDGKVGGWKLF